MNREIGGGGYGQNLAAWGSTAGVEGLKEKSAAQAITDQWYNDEFGLWPSFGLASISPPDAALHFSQVLWLATERVGCATVQCPSGTALDSTESWYTVCNYQPTGKS